jgi:NTE family protein
VIAPAQIGDMLLVDGGLTNNLPVDVARAMGADIVIAVNLGTPLMKREQLGSVLGVTGQMIGILTEQNVRVSLASLKPADVLIEPALGNFSATDFDHLPQAVPIGEAAARAAASRLAALSLPPTAYASLRERQQAPPPQVHGTVDEIRFPGLTRVNPDSLLTFLDTRRASRSTRSVSIATCAGSTAPAISSTSTTRSSRRREADRVGQRDREILGPELPSLRPRAAVRLQGRQLLQPRRKLPAHVGERARREWRTDVQMGQVGFLTTEWYQPLGTRNGMFIAPSATIVRRNIDIYQDSDRIARYDLSSSYGSLDIGRAFTRYGEIRVGVRFGRSKATLDTGPPELEPSPSSIPRAAITFRAVLDQLDNANFPREGFAGSLDLLSSSTALGARDNYTRWDLNAIAAKSWGRHTVMAGGRFAGALSGDTLPAYDLVQWGGFLQQSGLPAGALLGQQLNFGRVIYQYKLAEQKLIEGLYVGASAEVGRMDRPPRCRKPHRNALFRCVVRRCRYADRAHVPRVRRRERRTQQRLPVPG